MLFRVLPDGTLQSAPLAYEGCLSLSPFTDTGSCSKLVKILPFFSVDEILFIARGDDSQTEDQSRWVFELRRSHAPFASVGTRRSREAYVGRGCRAAVECQRSDRVQVVRHRKTEEWLADSSDGNLSLKLKRPWSVPQVTAHGMRGLHSTLALEHGACAHVVASSLGHESFSTTVAHYAKPEAITGDRKRRVLTMLDGGGVASSP